MTGHSIRFSFSIFALMNDEVKLYIYSADFTSELNLPYVDGGIKAGFPSSLPLTRAARSVNHC